MKVLEEEDSEDCRFGLPGEEGCPEDPKVFDLKKWKGRVAMN